MANVQFNLAGVPQDLPPNLLRYLTGVDTLLRGLNTYAIDYLQLDSENTDAIAVKLAERPHARRYIHRTLSLADVSLSSAPVSPTDGAIYYVNGVGSGAWLGMDNQIVLYSESSWEALGELEPGQLAWDQATETMYRAGNDGTLSALEQSAQSIVDSIQADATAEADLFSGTRYNETNWVLFSTSSTITKPAGWDSFRYYCTLSITLGGDVQPVGYVGTSGAASLNVDGLASPATVNSRWSIIMRIS